MVIWGRRWGARVRAVQGDYGLRVYLPSVGKGGREGCEKLIERWGAVGAAGDPFAARATCPAEWAENIKIYK